MQKIDQRIVIVFRKTRLDALTAKFNTKSQAKFYVARARVQHAMAANVASGPAQAAQLKTVEQAAENEMAQLETESRDYQEGISELRRQMDFDLPVQAVDRSIVPTMVFGPRDVIVAVGQDGLVANVAKYAVGLPIIGVNPDAGKYDGVLLPFQLGQVRGAVQRVLEGRAKFREVTLAEAKLNDGQRLLAFNELFIGAKTHVSARYRLEVGKKVEDQSSSGMIVSTGAGSTGWFSSVLNMASGVMNLGAVSRAASAAARPQVTMRWEDRELVYVVREPFVSKTSRAGVVAGKLRAGEQMTVESMMGTEGTIFSDGVESDSLEFSEGRIATIGVAAERARLVVA